MHILINFMETVVRLTIILFLIEVIAMAFLKHTLIGRILLSSMRASIKLIKICANGWARIFKVVVKEANILYKASTFNKKIVHGANVVDLANYIETQKDNISKNNSKKNI